MTRRAVRSNPVRALLFVSVSLCACVALLAVDVVATSDVLPGHLGSGASKVPAASPAAAADGGGQQAQVQQVPPQASPDMRQWSSIVASSIDSQTLDAAGVTVPYGGNILAAKIVQGGPTPAYDFYEAGGGAFADGFYPASSVKVLAAVAALEFIRSYGFTGAATITDGYDDGYTVYDVYNSALEYSDNDDYSELVRIAGVDWLNTVFLPEHGYDATTIQEPYGDDEQVADSPEMTLDEGGIEGSFPERTSYEDYGCDGSNCSTLFDMTDAIRRIVLNDSVPAAERFDVSADDLIGLQQSMLNAESWIAPGVYDVFGSGALIYSKPGYVEGLDCVDTALVVDPGTGDQYLIGVTAPDDDGCDVLATMAEDVLTVLKGRPETSAVRTDGSIVAVANGKQVGEG